MIDLGPAYSMFVFPTAPLKYQLPIPMRRKFQEIGMARKRQMQAVPAFSDCLGHIQDYCPAQQQHRMNTNGIYTATRIATQDT